MFDTEKRRPSEIYGEKLIDLGNLALVAMVFGQFLDRDAIRWGVALVGTGLFVLIYVIAYFLLKNKKGIL